ncbi:MAG TPA: hypothetical protein VKA09_08355 [Nitrososphaeraceae archaeon]|jgi:hypothetical protein|nr:hypothetical protein [Nitrososphaeraceae archaeon]
MEKSKEVKITLMAVTTALPIMILLFAAATTIAPLQQAYSLSKYVLTADNTNPATDDASGKIYQPLEKDPTDKAKPAPIPTTTSNSSIVPVGCAMDTIESLESFLSCLGAK